MKRLVKSLQMKEPIFIEGIGNLGKTLTTGQGKISGLVMEHDYIAHVVTLSCKGHEGFVPVGNIINASYFPDVPKTIEVPVFSPGLIAPSGAVKPPVIPQDMQAAMDEYKAELNDKPAKKTKLRKNDSNKAL